MKKEKWYQIKEKIRIIVLMFMVAVATYQLTAMDICDSVEGNYTLQTKENTLGIFGECVKMENKISFETILKNKTLEDFDLEESEKTKKNK